MAAYTLRLLGPVDVRDTHDRPLEALARQPKKMLLLAYLAMCSSEGWIRRETVSALFWPESDSEKGRHSLRQSLYFIRNTLGDDGLLTRGTEEIRVDLERLWCDVPALEAALRTGRLRDAHTLYRGDLLEGLFAHGISTRLEQIIETRRARLKERMAEAAWELAERGAAAGDALEVHHWSRRAIELSREVESAYRRLMMLLNWVGDAGAALVVHENLVERLEDDLGVAPSPETEHLAEQLQRGLGRRTGLPGLSPPSHAFSVGFLASARSSRPATHRDFDGNASPAPETHRHLLVAGWVLLTLAVVLLIVLTL